MLESRVLVNPEPPVVHEVLSYYDGEPLVVGDVLVLGNEYSPCLLCYI